MPATRRPVALAAAVATVVAIGATALAVPAFASGGTPAAPAGPAAPGGPAAPQLELKDGTLEWGFKESFRKYLLSPVASGKITAADGATQAPGNGVFTFTDGKGSYDTGTHATATTFKGSVHFEGHHGVLDIELSDVKVNTGRTEGEITADVTSVTEGRTETRDDVSIADLDLTVVTPGQGENGAMVFKDIPAKLTAEGSEAFAGFYAAGAELDPATLSATAAKAPTDEPTDEPTEDPTDDPTDEPTEEPTDEPTDTPIEEPTEEPTNPAVVDGPIVDGNLDWGVKKSFRTYVTGPIAKGKVELAAGATRSGDAYRFPKATGSFDADAQTLSAEFEGSVRFLGHEEAGSYVLDLKLSGLEAEVEGGKGTLVADVSTKDRETHEVSTFEDLTIATLDLPTGELKAKDGVVALNAVPASLTADGTKAFGGMYQEGETLDALTAAVSLTADGRLPGGSGGTAGGSGTTADTTGTTAGTAGGGSVGGTTGGTGNLASTGAEVPAGALMGAAGALAVAGGVAVFVARRRNPATGEG